MPLPSKNLPLRLRKKRQRFFSSEYYICGRNVYHFKNVKVFVGMEKTDLTQDETASAMETKNPLAVFIKGPLKYQTKVYAPMPEPYKTSKYIMIQRSMNAASYLELAEVKVLGETSLIS